VIRIVSPIENEKRLREEIRQAVKKASAGKVINLNSLSIRLGEMYGCSYNKLLKIVRQHIIERGNLEIVGMELKLREIRGDLDDIPVSPDDGIRE